MSVPRSEVLVVGAGIIGATLASSLSRRGVEVVLVDPHAGKGASAGNAGLVVPSYATPMSTPENLRTGLRALGSGSGAVTFERPVGLQTLRWLTRFTMACRSGRVRRDTAVLHRLARESLQIYQGMREHGLDVGLRESGWLWLSTGGPVLSPSTPKVRGLRTAGADCAPVDADEVHALQPGLGQAVTGGLWFPHESVLDPARATSVLLQDAMDHGARLVPEKVLDVVARDGVVRAVRTATQELEADQFVIATGSASREVGRLFGMHIPVEPGYGWSVSLKEPTGLLERALMGIEDHVVISPLPGRIRITGGMRFGGPNGSRPSQGDIAALRVAAERLLPRLRDLPVHETWQGARPMTASGVPLVHRADGRNVVVAAGHGPLGVTLAPSTAKAVTSELLFGRTVD